MFGRATIRLGIGPHSSLIFKLPREYTYRGSKNNNRVTPVIKLTAYCTVLYSSVQLKYMYEHIAVWQTFSLQMHTGRND